MRSRLLSDRSLGDDPHKSCACAHPGEVHAARHRPACQPWGAPV